MTVRWTVRAAKDRSAQFARESNPVTPTKICALCTKKSVLFIRLGLIFLFIISNLLLCQKTTVLTKRFLSAQDTGFADF